MENVDRGFSLAESLADAQERADLSLDERQLAMVYAPSQKFAMLYASEDALLRGTLYEQLDKPLIIGGARNGK